MEGWRVGARGWEGGGRVGKVGTERRDDFRGRGGFMKLVVLV